jgi:hypothetical protein
MEPQPKDVIDMVKVTTTLNIAEGAIEARSEQKERLDEVVDRLAEGEFHVPVEGAIPCKCIDGRHGAEGLAPNAAGGTETLMVADDLTNKRFSHENGTTLDHYRNIVAVLQGEGYPVGGHTDNHAQGEVSGCGANDRLPLIYDFISRYGDELKSLTESLGVAVSDETHALILENAGGRSEFSAGAELLSALEAAAGPESIDRLVDGHNEVAAVINLRAGTTLDRKALAAEFGPNYQAFNVDAWSFAEAAQAISLSQEEVDQKVVAMVYYNLATAGVLCGKNMRVIVRN